jgi:hypothetical protein
MTLDDFVARGWQDHGDDAEGVWVRLPQGIPLVETPPGLFALANLAAHVAGEHLGRWDDGIAYLDGLTRLSAFDPASAEGKGLRRLQAALDYCAGRSNDADRRTAEAHPGGALHPSATRIRMLAVAASALAHHHRLEEANAAFDEALELASYGPGADDPAAKALAITGNNMACELEELPTRDEAQRQLMLRAAKVARRFWEIAGSWREVERAEYRLSSSHRKAGLPGPALAHASECLRIVLEHGSEPGELFFAHEALALANHARGNAAAAREERDRAAAALSRIADAGFKEYCAAELAKLDEQVRIGG